MRGALSSYSDSDWEKKGEDSSSNQNLISWSNDNLLAVAYGEYIDIIDLRDWDSDDLDPINYVDTIHASATVTKVSWCPLNGNGNILAYSCKGVGIVACYDINASREIGSRKGFDNQSILCFDWHPNRNRFLTTGYADGTYHEVDFTVRRAKPTITWCPIGREGGEADQEVTNVKYHEDGHRRLYTLGDANTEVVVTDDRTMKNDGVITRHAIKSIDWCPFQKNVTAAYKHGKSESESVLELWDTDEMNTTERVRTKSPVTNLVSSIHQPELCCTTNDSLQIWSYTRGRLELSRQFYQDSPIVSVALNPHPGATMSQDLGFLCLDGSLKLGTVFGNQSIQKPIYDTTHIVDSKLPRIWGLGLPTFDQKYSSIR